MFASIVVKERHCRVEQAKLGWALGVEEAGQHNDPQIAQRDVVLMDVQIRRAGSRCRTALPFSSTTEGGLALVDSGGTSSSSV